jgi:hypothetical protein
VKKVHSGIAVVIILCMAIAGTGVLQMIHVSQCVSHSFAAGHHQTKQAGKCNGHDQDNCSFCQHFAFTRTIPAQFAGQIILTDRRTEKISVPESAVLQSVFPASVSSRAPPIL